MTPCRRPSCDEDRLCERVPLHTPTGALRACINSSEESGMKHDEVS